MPRIRANRYDYMTADKVRRLHGELLAEGIRDTEVAEWLGCTSQNVGSHFKRGTFSLKQYIIMMDKLDAVKAKRRQA